MTIAACYDEWSCSDGFTTRSEQEARLYILRDRDTPAAAVKHSWDLLPPGAAVRHADYQMLVGRVHSIDFDPMTRLPYIISWANPQHAMVALGIESARAHPSKIQSLEEPVR